MEHAVIAALLEKYWSAETTVEEEKTLAAYFTQPSIDPELEPYRDLFGWYAEEATLAPSQDLESRILESIRQADSAQHGNPVTQSELSALAPVRPLYRHAFRYAAAAVVLIGLGIYLIVQPAGDTGTSTPGGSIPSPIAQTDNHAVGTAAITDTYDDPQAALAAIRKALFTASVKMNKGKKITQQNMDRLSESWQSAVNN